MATIEKYKLKSGTTRWRIVGAYLGVNPKTGKQARTNLQGFKTQREAKIELSRIEAQVLKGTYFEESKSTKEYTFKEVYEMWLKEYRLTVTESTYLSTTSDFDLRILPEIGNYRMNQIKHKDIQELVDKWKDFTNCKRWISRISRVYRYAIPLNYADSDPTEFITIPKPKKSEPKKLFYEKHELELFVKTLDKRDDPKIKSYLRLLIFGGLRNGEVLGLRWSHIDFKNNLITIDQAVGRRKVENKKTELYLKEPKNDSSTRTISIDQKTIDVLREYKKYATDGLVFKSKKGGILSDSKARKWLRSVAKEANLKPIKVHGLRHTHASLLFEAGASIKYVQHRLGHSDIQTTMNIYTHVTKKTIEDFSEKFSDYFSDF